MAYRKVGEAVTDENGRAVINYSGTGAGLIELIAETTIDGSIIQSEIYEVIDGTFLDRAVTGQKNTNWTNPSSNIQEYIDDTGTLLTNSNTSAMHYWANNYSEFNTGFAVEFDLIEYTDNTLPAFRLIGTNTHQLVFKTIGCPQNSHLKIIVDGTGIKYQIGNGTITDFVTTTDTAFRMGFRFAGQCSIKYKNFVAYPI